MRSCAPTCAPTAVRLLLTGAAVFMPAAASGQSDFLVERPDATFALMGGWALAGEGSDLFAFTREQLTVEKGDFSSPVGMAEAALRLTERLDLALGLEHASATVNSAMRDWVTEEDQPIPQRTRFSRTRFLVSARFYPLPRGRTIGSFAWVPNRWSPYIGGGVGLSSYEFRQAGDFVDYRTLDIFEDELSSRGRGTTAHGVAGAQLSLTPRFMLRGEYGYVWGSAEVEQDVFTGFEDIDLSGSRVLVGLAARW